MGEWRSASVPESARRRLVLSVWARHCVWKSKSARILRSARATDHHVRSAPPDKMAASRTNTVRRRYSPPRARTVGSLFTGDRFLPSALGFRRRSLSPVGVRSGVLPFRAAAERRVSTLCRAPSRPPRNRVSPACVASRRQRPCRLPPAGSCIGPYVSRSACPPSVLGFRRGY